MEYLKSPLNYTGNKHKLLDQIIPLFPKNINTFYDLFGGSFTVGININANKIVYNEFNKFIAELVKYVSTCNVEEELRKIDNIISKYKLSKNNKESYYFFRDNVYNKNQKPELLFILICFSLNCTIRFNQKEMFNQSCGIRDFNKNIRNRFKKFNEIAKNKNIDFYNKDFKKFTLFTKNDFIYLDPPYNLTTTPYNETSRLGGGWTLEKEQQMYKYIDYLNSENVKFALSNVSIYRNEENTILNSWSKKYNVHNLNFTYKNNNSHKKDNTALTQEVLITNY